MALRWPITVYRVLQSHVQSSFPLDCLNSVFTIILMFRLYIVEK